MFCSQCGQHIPDGSSFCNNCGNKINGAEVAVQEEQAQSPIDYQAQKNSIRQSELDSLTQVLDYFSLKRDKFDEFDEVTEKVEYYSEGAKSALLVWGCINISFSLLFLLISSSTYSEGFFTFSLLSAFLSFCMITGGILMKINNRIQYSKYQERYEQLKIELLEYYMCYPNCPIGPEFANPKMLEKILNILHSGRADTIKESINEFSKRR